MTADGLTITSGTSHPVTIQPIPPVTEQYPPVQKAGEPENVSNTAPVPEQKKFDPEHLAKIAQEINEGFRIFNTSISFDVDKATGSTVIRILDRDTKKIIREIPPAEFLKLASRLAEIIGRIVDKTA